ERPPIWIPILTASIVGVCGQSLNQLAAGFAGKVFHVGATQFGLLVGMFGGGGIVMSVLIALIGERIPRSRLTHAGLFRYARATTALGLASSYGVALGAFLLMGLAHVMVQVSVSTSMQIHVDEAFRGRVTSLYLTGIMVSVPIGSLVGGLIGEGFGLEWTARIYGVILLGYGVFVWLGLGSLRILD